MIATAVTGFNPSLKRCGARKGAICPCRQEHVGSQEGRNPLADVPPALPWTRSNRNK